MRDRRLLYLTAFVRALGTGLIGVLLGVYLARLGLEARAIGLIVSAGLAGAATATFLVTLLGDRIGYRRALLLIALLTAIGGGLLAHWSHPLLLGAAAFLGMVNGMGRDRGVALVLEQAALPATVSDTGRTMAFARYNVLQDAGHALGGLLAGLPTLLQATDRVSESGAFRASVLVYAALMLLPAAAYLALSRELDVPLVLGAAMKIGYDLLLWRAFRHVRPPEERRAAAEA